MMTRDEVNQKIEEHQKNIRLEMREITRLADILQETIYMNFCDISFNYTPEVQYTKQEANELLQSGKDLTDKQKQLIEVALTREMDDEEFEEEHMSAYYDKGYWYNSYQNM